MIWAGFFLGTVCLEKCDTYRLGDFVNGYWQKQNPKLNITQYTCKRWPKSVACCYTRYTNTFRSYPALCKCIQTLPKANLSNVVAVHLRLGDVLDWDHYKLKRHCNGNTGCHYVRPLNDYKKINIPHNVTEIVIVGNPHYRENRINNTNSLKYLHAVKDIFIKRNFSVDIRTSGSADSDLAYLSTSSYLIPGRGGYASLARYCTLGVVLK